MIKLQNSQMEEMPGAELKGRDRGPSMSAPSVSQPRSSPNMVV